MAKDKPAFDETLQRTRDLSRIIKSLFGSGGLSVLGMAAAFLTGIQLARYMTHEAFGIYSGVIAVFFLLMIPPQMGLPTLMMRMFSVRTDDETSNPALLGVLHYALVGIPLVALACALAATGVLQIYGWVQYAGWGFGIILLYPALAVARGVLIGLDRVVLTQALEQLVRPLVFAALLYALSDGPGSMTIGQAMLAHLVAAAVAAVVMIAFALGAVRRARIAAPGGTGRGRVELHTRDWIRSGLPIVGSEIFRTYSTQAAILIAAFFVLPDALGQLRIALTVATILGVPQSVASVVLVPILSRLHASGEKDRLEGIVEVTTALVVALQLAGFAVLAVFGVPLVSLVFGPAYVDSVPLILVVMAGQVVFGLLGPGAVMLLMAGHERFVFWSYALSGALLTGLALALVPQVGVLGAAVASSVAMAGQALACALRVRRDPGYRLDLLSGLGRLMRRRTGTR